MLGSVVIMVLRAVVSVQLLFVVVHCYVFINDSGDENCSTLLDKSQHGNEYENESMLFRCPPWFFPDNHTGTCKPGSSLDGQLEIDMSLMQTRVMHCNCMTESDGAFSVGFCLHKCLHYASYYSLPCNVSELDHTADLNRDGLLCSQCKHGFGIPVYSYSLACVKCVDYKYNWMKYIAVVYVPLTLFYIFVTLFSINFTSITFTSIVMLCQICSNPLLARLILSGLHAQLPLYYIAGKIVITFISVWNLDFFRAFYSFCLYPGASQNFIMALEFVKAFYPLLLIGVTFLLVKLHDNHCKLVVWGWRIILSISKPLRYNVELSLVKVFSTFIYLSASQILLTSMMFLVPSNVYTYLQKSDGTMVLTQKHFAFLSEAKYFGKDSVVYALMAIASSTIFFTVPVLLLLFYQLSCFRRILNKVGLNSLALHTFVDVFEGDYKDGTNGTRDFRYFSGLILLVPLIIYITFAYTLSTFYYPLSCTLLVVFATLYVLFKPLKHSKHNLAVAGMLLSVAFLALCVILENLSSNTSVNSSGFSIVILLLNFCMYIVVIVSAFLVKVYKSSNFYYRFRC